MVPPPVLDIDVPVDCPPMLDIPAIPLSEPKDISDATASFDDGVFAKAFVEGDARRNLFHDINNQISGVGYGSDDLIDGGGDR